MSITDELRHNIEGAEQLYGCECKHLLAIADHIDAEHERECKEQYACGVEHGIGASIDASMIQTHGYVELPKDADGEYIHIGDVMELVSYDEDYRPVIRTVDAVGEQVFFAWSKVNGRYTQYEACAYRHYHKPTVEDVLTEFGIDWEHESDCEDRAALLKEYASKLRLAKEDA